MEEKEELLERAMEGVVGREVGGVTDAEVAEYIERAALTESVEEMTGEVPGAVG